MSWSCRSPFVSSSMRTCCTLVSSRLVGGEPWSLAIRASHSVALVWEYRRAHGAWVYAPPRQELGHESSQE
jgi:hypothetical protein